MSSLPILVDNLAAGIHKANTNINMITKTAKRLEINSKIESFVLNTQTLRII